jgi:membrane protease YdiL (CAAX protease family)
LQTDIGRGFSPVRARVGLLVALLALGADLWSVKLRYPETSYSVWLEPLINSRWAIALTALVAQVWLSGGDLPTLGLSGPSGGWRKWLWLSVSLGLIIGGFLIPATVLWVVVGLRLPVEAVAPEEIGPSFLRMCVFAPLLEESLYRVALCVPLTALTGPYRAIAVSGLAFGLLHFLYRNPSPENLLGGVFLAWVYLRSSSIVVPVALHAVGNLVILVGQVAIWYWLGDTPLIQYHG